MNSGKFLEPFLRKLRYQPTNQPIITNNTDFIGPGWRQPNKVFFWKNITGGAI